MKDNRPLGKEDYTDEACLLCDPATGKRYGAQALPMSRITEKLDEYVSRGDFASAARHLDYWLSEARYNGDMRGEFSVLNEMMGFYRKQGDSEKAFGSLEAALMVMRRLGMEDNLSAATCYVNCGTVCTAFGQSGRALGYFEKAREIYEGHSSADPSHLGGLYNNMALALTDCGRFDEAMESYEKALEVMGKVSSSQVQRAVTLMNMADCVALMKGDDVSFSDIRDYVSGAMELMEDPDVVRDSYYAYECARFAPGFDYYGFGEYARELSARSEKILKGEKSEGT